MKYDVSKIRNLLSDMMLWIKIKLAKWFPQEFMPSSVQFSSVAQSCPTLCDPMNRSIPGLPVHHQLPEFTQTHIHWVGDAIQPSHPLSSPFPPAPNPSQHQSLFQWVNFRMRWPKCWSFSFSIIPPKEHPGLETIANSVVSFTTIDINKMFWKTVK